MIDATRIDSTLRAEIQTLVDDHYDLGDIAGLEEFHGGYCNRNFMLVVVRGGHRRKLLVRKYNPQAVESGIHFEHALLRHLHANGFKYASQVIACRNGAYHFRMIAPGKPATFWALFSFLEGDDLYSWTRTDMKGSEFDSAAAILAELHTAGRDFVKPPGADQAQPQIMTFLPTLTETFGEYTHKAHGRRCDGLFLDDFESILAAVDGCAAARDRFEGMIQLPIHGDFHPGNLKYCGGKGVGVFDFDWAKIDYRLFDVALALVYFCGVWAGKGAGSLCLKRVKRFLQAYDHTCRRLTGLKPLTRQEKLGLQFMVAAANLYVLHWDLMDYYNTPDPDDDEYYRYIHHNLRLMHWIESQAAEIRAAANATADAL